MPTIMTRDEQRREQLREERERALLTSDYKFKSPILNEAQKLMKGHAPWSRLSPRRAFELASERRRKVDAARRLVQRQGIAPANESVIDGIARLQGERPQLSRIEAFLELSQQRRAVETLSATGINTRAASEAARDARIQKLKRQFGVGDVATAMRRNAKQRLTLQGQMGEILSLKAKVRSMLATAQPVPERGQRLLDWPALRRAR